MSKQKNSLALLAGRIEAIEDQLTKIRTVDPDAISERLKLLEDSIFSTKEVLTAKDVCNYLDISHSMLYKLTCSGKIPHFKPRGKMVFFEKKEIVEWVKKNHIGNIGNVCDPVKPEINDAKLK